MPRREYHFWVYIMASRSHQLYIGFTNDLRVRISQHKELRPGTYTAQYNIDQLVYFESFGLAISAITREKELKRWNRIKKVALIVSANPTWRDLSLDWGKPTKPFSESDLKPPKTFGNP